jgi:uncharacterized repeat protein (TIGR01451 family)
MALINGAGRHPLARLGLALMLVPALLVSLFASGTAQASVPTPSVQPYNQTFDSLINAGSAAWQNNVTLKSWYAAAGNTPITTITAYNYDNPPASVPGGLYSFGATGSSDRALGLIGSFTNTPKRMGVVLRNTSGSRIKRLTISYTGEQWRDGNTITTTERLQFKYKKSATGATLGAADIQTGVGFTNYPALDFDSPQNSAQGPINGKDPANSRAISATIELHPDLYPNQEMMLVWEKDNVSPGADDGLAIDNLAVHAGFDTALPVASCPSSVSAFQGTPATALLSAFDPNGTVTQAQITSGAVSGISLVNQTPATSVGGTYTATLRIDGAAAGTYQVVVQFTSQELNETRSCTINVSVRNNTDLAVAKDGPATYKPGEPVSYALTVDPGAQPASTVIVTDTLPAGLTYVSDNSGGTVTGQTVVWNLGTLTAQKVISLTAMAATNASDPLTNSVTASTTTIGDDPSNNTATTTAQLYVGAPDFSESSKTVDRTSVQIGDVFTYTLSVDNGGDAATTYTLTDVLPSNLTVVALSPGLTQTGSILTASGPIDAGALITYTVSVRANAEGTVANAATLTGDGTTRTLTAPAVTVGPRKLYLPMIIR